MTNKLLMLIFCIIAVTKLDGSDQPNSSGGLVYTSKSRLPWVKGTVKYRNSDLLAVQDALLNGTPDALYDCLANKNLTNIQKFDDNPLGLAILCGKKYAIAPLVAAGARMDSKDDQGKDFIDMAYENSDSPMVIELMKAKQQQDVLLRRSPLFIFRQGSPVERSASVSPFCYSPGLDVE